MKIASWNVNSIKQRQEHVVKWLEQTGTDVLLLQELKGTELPEEIINLDYRHEAVPQKGRNGVAILARHEIAVVKTALTGEGEEEQARYIEADIGGWRIINIYAPNGNPVDSEKFDYKLSWLDCLYARLSELREEGVPFVIGGDFNVIPEDRDCHDPVIWAGDALFRIESRQKFRALCHLGLTDAFRVFDQRPGQYTFWDYQAGAWPANKGIRIDHFLLSPPAADRLKSCVIDAGPRGWDKPSDHTPIIIELE